MITPGTHDIRQDGYCFRCRTTFSSGDEAKRTLCVVLAPAKPQHDPVNRPQHYTQHPSGVECIQVTEHFNFCVGNAIKYLWRAPLKNGLEDLRKARWYIDREIQRLEKEGKANGT